MTQIIVTQRTQGGAVPSIGGVGGSVAQDAVTTITTHTGAVIRVIGLRSDMGGYDVSDDVPASASNSHEAIVAYWKQEAERWAASAARPSTPEVIEVHQFEIDGKTVNAPGFEREQFIAFVERAKEAQLRTTPAEGHVLVMSGSSDARYAVTREHCDCQGHLGHGRCYHRAYAIWLQDVQGVDVMRVPVIGVNKRGVALTTGRKIAAKVVA